MPNWIDHRWVGLPDKINSIRDAFRTDPRIGTMVPHYDEPVRVLDGLSAISFLATEAIPAPEGIDPNKPQTLTVIHGVL